MMTTNNSIALKIKLLFLALLSVAWCSCQREPAPGDGGALTVHLVGTKAITGASAAEMQVNSLHLYVFDAQGLLDQSHACTDAEQSNDCSAFLQLFCLCTYEKIHFLKECF